MLLRVVATAGAWVVALLATMFAALVVAVVVATCVAVIAALYDAPNAAIIVVLVVAWLAASGVATLVAATMLQRCSTDASERLSKFCCCAGCCNICCGGCCSICCGSVASVAALVVAGIVVANAALCCRNLPYCPGGVVVVTPSLAAWRLASVIVGGRLGSVARKNEMEDTDFPP